MATVRAKAAIADFIAPIELIPVCSPSLIEPIGDRDDSKSLSRHTLLHSFARPRDWATWLASRGLVNVDPDRGLKFENSVLAYEAALQGMGVAIGVRILVEQYLLGQPDRSIRAGVAAEQRLLSPYPSRAPT